MALVSLASVLGQEGIAAGILLCFWGLLRISEALSLKWRSLVVQLDAVLLLLGRTKRGVDEKVVVDELSVITWLSRLRQRRASENDSSIDDLPVCNASYSKVRYWMGRMAALLHISDIRLSGHSFRGGGASTLLSKGKAMADIALHGRWSSESSCREYLTSWRSIYDQAANAAATISVGKDTNS
eukprot:TRINITY_DN13874_c0_g1_i1.p1 TRINITY_DN13874_c0_g1~~TRINITY_DN13874_c0_g1_i1.p1  ORF type:complete len:200 (-),score=26.82 TRINITY_DN13874_c0_g1_i1:996-1547(-)